MESTEQKKAQKRGSWFESKIAKIFKGVRVGRSKAVKVFDEWTQVNCQKPPDVITPKYSIECKYYKSLPKFLDKIVTQSVSNCPKGKIPLAVIGDRGERYTLVIWLLPDFEKEHIGERG